MLASLAILGLPSTPAGAVALGDLTLSSVLGQPLRASIPVQLGPGEAVAADCVQVTTPATRIGRLPPTRLEVIGPAGPGSALIRLSSSAPLVEPLYELVLGVRCAGTAAVVRQYVLMPDLPGMAPLPGATGQASAATLTVTESPPPPPAGALSGAKEPDRPSLATPAPPAAALATGLSRARTPIPAGGRYRVVAGDTLYAIARRVAPERPVWDVAGEIMAANPEAFIRNDPNLLRLGAEILIPGSEPAASSLPPPVAASSPAAPASVATAAAMAASPPASPSPPGPAAAVAPAVSLPGPDTVAAAVPPAAVTSGGLDGMSRIAPRESTAPPGGPVPQQPIAVSPWTAALAGGLFGLLVGGLLWLGWRLADPWLGRQANRRSRAARSADEGRMASPDGVRTVTLPLAVAPRTLEGDMTAGYAVEEAADDALAAEFAAPASESDDSGTNLRRAEEITAELAELFDGDLTADMPAPTGPGRASANPAEVDVGTPAHVQEVDFLLGDDDVTRLAEADLTAERTIEATSRNAIPTADEATSSSGTLDLPALAAAGGHGPTGQTLKEALHLLERDYENEFTASTLLNPAAVRAALDPSALDDETPEPTQIHVRRRSG